MNTFVYIGLGSNLHNPLEQIEQAVSELTQLRHLQQVTCSPIYRSVPLGPQDQPDYINCVVRCQTTLLPHHLLDELQRIENMHGRVRNRHWGERTLDLDLLLYGSAIIRTPRLTVPHPHMKERSFVLYPLADLTPHIPPSTGINLSLLLQHVKNDLVYVKKVD